MDVSTVTTLISSVGFPIVCVFGMGWWVKTTHDDHRKDIQRLQEMHAKETEALTEAVNNNTIVIQRLVGKLEGVNSNE